MPARPVAVAARLLATLFVLDAAAAQGGVLWVQHSPANRPAPRWGHAMVFDAANRRIVMFGGRAAVFSPTSFDDTWEWDGGNWSPCATPVAQRPAARSGHGMAYDSVRERVVLFGGESSTGSVLDDTWEWDGTSWTFRSTGPRPSARAEPGMVFHVATARTLVCGGYAHPYQNQASTWEWDGSTWQQHQGNSPPGNFGEMAYDAARERTVALSGAGLGYETWEWDGVGWSLVHPETGTTLSGVRLAYDEQRRRVVSFGGYDGVWTFHVTWEWDGSSWSSRGPQATVRSRSWQAMAYDRVGQRIVMFGGLWQNTVFPPHEMLLDDTWSMSSRTPAASISYGSGCPGGATALDSGPALFSLPWTGDTFTVELRGLPVGSLPFLVAGFGREQIDLGPVGLPGCTQWVRADAAFALGSGGPTATWSVFVPNSPALIGVVLDLQGAALNAGGANAPGAVLSGAFEAVVGMR